MTRSALSLAMTSIQNDHPGADVQVWTGEGRYEGQAKVISNATGLIAVQQADGAKLVTWFIAAEHVVAIRKAP